MTQGQLDRHYLVGPRIAKEIFSETGQRWLEIEPHAAPTAWLKVYWKTAAIPRLTVETQAADASISIRSKGTGSILLEGSVSLTGTLSLDGNLQFVGVSRKIIAGTVSLLIRNNADSNSNISITDAGLVGLRNTLSISAGGAT